MRRRAPNEKISSECTDLCNGSCTGSGRVPRGDAHAHACVHARPAPSCIHHPSYARARTRKQVPVHTLLIMRMHTDTALQDMQRVPVASAFDRHGAPAEVTQACAAASGFRRRAPLPCFMRPGCSRRCVPRATMRPPGTRNAPRRAERSCRERVGPTKAARAATKTCFQN